MPTFTDDHWSKLIQAGNERAILKRAALIKTATTLADEANQLAAEAAAVVVTDPKSRTEKLAKMQAHQTKLEAARQASQAAEQFGQTPDDILTIFREMMEVLDVTSEPEVDDDLSSMKAARTAETRAALVTAVAGTLGADEADVVAAFDGLTG